ncbi:MAG: PAS domain S-box protein [Desulfotignum sp.]|nr:PAS domain S-box protein [Desulfotignum sp.]MCF8090330.1 PAS domain S-box protein [Desulfotignum sp.]
MRCHGDPRNAPEEMVAMYGPERSFHRKIGEVVSAVSIRIPLASAYASANKTSIVLTALLLVSFAFIYGIQFLINRRLIFQPLSLLQAKADKITTGDESIGTEIPLPKGLELRSLARSFNRMSFRLRDHIDHLDDKIEKRTTDIKRINDSLKKEIEQHQGTNSALLESEQTFRQMFDHTAVGIAQVSLDFCITKANRAYCTMLGYSEKDLIGKHLADITHPEDVGENLRKQKQLGTGSVDHYRMEKTFVHKNGDKVYGILDANLIRDKEGTPKYFLGSVVDITKRKRLENQLIQNQKMESIGTLAGGIAHDFNNILSSIIGYTELALDEVEKDTNLGDNLQAVYLAGKRAENLVKQILTISRHDEKEVKPIQVAPLVKESLKMLRSTMPTSIEFQENISSEQLVVNADPTQLQQVIVNLATNAKQAMVEGSGVLTVMVDTVAVESDIQNRYPGMQPGNYVRTMVRDTGSGIPAKNLEKIFEPYFTTKDKGEGTGLGLSVVHGIVKSHHGHITVHSEVGKGTTFQVYLPLIKKLSADLPEKAAESMTGGTETVLVVDDEVSIAKMLQRILESLGYRVFARTSSLEALEAFRQSPDKFDLVITDMTMPKMTGDRLAGEIKAIRSDIPVILCTGFSEQIHGKGDDLNIDRFLMKPIDKAKMATTIRQALDGTCRG